MSRSYIMTKTHAEAQYHDLDTCQGEYHNQSTSRCQDTCRGAISRPRHMPRSNIMTKTHAEEQHHDQETCRGAIS
eukprot:1391852-Amorphochlora_amoeboformis.AAC.1